MREWGKRIAIRRVFGFEALREPVLRRIHGLEDRIVETVKSTSSQLDWRARPTLEAVTQ